MALCTGFSYPSDPIPQPSAHPGRTKLPSGKRTVSEPCERCSGQGKVDIEMPRKVPLERLEGGATGFVQREYAHPKPAPRSDRPVYFPSTFPDFSGPGLAGRRTCPDCGGFGTTTSEKDYYDDEGALCNHPEGLLRSLMEEAVGHFPST